MEKLPTEIVRADRHHVLYTRHTYNRMEETRDLRNHDALLIRVERHAHQATHNNIPAVPLLPRKVAQHVLDRFWGDIDDPMASIDELMLGIEYGSRCRDISARERARAARTIDAIDLQRPYIAEGLSRATIMDMGRIAMVAA